MTRPVRFVRCPLASGFVTELRSMCVCVHTMFIINIYKLFCSTHTSSILCINMYAVKNWEISSRGRSVGAIWSRLLRSRRLSPPPPRCPRLRHRTTISRRWDPGGSFKRQLAPRLHGGVVVTLGPGFCAPDDTRLLLLPKPSTRPEHVV